MDKAKILRQCNEIERAVNELYVKRLDSISSEERIALINMLGVIVTEITAPPKSNADRIRQMTDEELAEMVSMKVCRIVKPDGKDCPKGFYFGKCDKCVETWLKQEVSEDETD